MNIDAAKLLKVIRDGSDVPVDRVAIVAALAKSDWLLDVLVHEARAAGAEWPELAEALGATSGPPEASSTTSTAEASPNYTVPTGSAQEHTGKYRPLWSYLRDLDKPQITMSFSEIERVLGFALPPSSREHQPHWYGYKGSAVARAVIDAGWKAHAVDLRSESVTFVRGGRGRRTVVAVLK